MNRRKLLAAAALAVFALLVPAGPTAAQSLVDPAAEKKIDDLLARMTIEEKAGQLNQYSSSFDLTGPAPSAGGQKAVYEQIRTGLVGSMLNVIGAEATRKAQQLAVENSRLRIPLIFGYDVIHGYKTIFPIPLGEAASWDPAAVERSARVAATEAAAAGLHWTFAPMVDIARDARWGRIMEGSGEDPYLGGQMAAARVRGFQGDSLSATDTVAACVKHYAAYGFAEAGRDYNTVDISEQTLRNVVLPPFKAAADAGAATFMNSFNEIAGIPATGSVHLQREILKGEWGFTGFVVSDWGSIGEMLPHGYSKDLEQAAEQAITAGSDMDMESRAYVGHLAGLVKAGRVDERLVDDAVRRVLRVKFALGLFDDPYRYSDTAREKAATLTPANLEAARDVARRSIVLLKNGGGLLPLRKDLKTIAVIGPFAADKDAPLGNWRGQGEANSAVSLLEGVKAAVSPATEVLHAEGVKLVTGPRNFMAPPVYNTTDRSGIPAAAEAARKAEVVLLAIGEDAFQSGEGRSQADIGLKGLQDELLRAVVAANPKVVVVLSGGRPLAIPDVAEAVPALVETWLLGSQSGHAIADVLFGDFNPSGRLPVSFPRHVGQMPLYYAHKNTGRPGPQDVVTWSHFTDVPNDALFPFGFGLGYTTFAYSDPVLSASEIGAGGELQVRVRVTNTGSRPGTEVVQLYVRDLVGSVTRPVKELKGFQRVELAAGESREVSFTLTPEDLAFHTARGQWEAEPGAFTVMVGGNSRDVNSASFTLR
ncbi:MAG TPA: beta-glucosidase BglX [Vicinamibacterales bacterium]|nr:beta-glucosidase BglX [Vicinamibacterales bacterium]